MNSQISIRALPGIGEIHQGIELVSLIASAMGKIGLRPTSSDVVVIAQKAISKAEGRVVDLTQIVPGARAKELAILCRKDPRLVEVILSESLEVLRVKPNVLIVRHRLGYVMASAGVDQSNVASNPGEERVLLLPLDPDASAARLRERFVSVMGVAPGIVISDSFGRAWRQGVVNVALGAAGVPSLWDRRGETDRAGRKLEVTLVAWADAVAAAAGIIMGEAAEGTPVVVVQGLQWHADPLPAAALLRPVDEDLFR